MGNVRRRRLVRAANLAQFREALAHLATTGQPLSARRRALILPTRAAIEIFRQHLEARALRSGARATVFPDLLTRDELVVRLHQTDPALPRLLGRLEREVLMERAAREAASRARMSQLPFELRPDLIAAMLTFYDELRRRQRSVRRFAHVLLRELVVERDTDRGSESLIHQTCFLAFAFLAYERGMTASGGLDEHALRRRLVANDWGLAWDHLVVAVADHPSDPRGLWPADFDLLSRHPSVLNLDVVVTDEMHDAGFRERMEHELPGIEEIRAETFVGAPITVSPALVADGDALCAVHRDREEELRQVARTIRADAQSTGHELDGRVAIVFQRPLPYLYLAKQVLADSGIPFQTLDALPLATEPFAAATDLVLEFATTGGSRASTVALLRSPLLTFVDEGEPVAPEDASALDTVLTERRASGGPDSYAAEVHVFLRAGAPREKFGRAIRAARAAAAIAGELAVFNDATSMSRQLEGISGFLRRHQRGPNPEDLWRDRYLRARAAVLGVIEGLATAARLHDDRPRSPVALAALVRAAIERQTFASRQGGGGVALVDASAARFGEFDQVHLVGLIETEWPDRPRRNIFYAAGLLKTLGWPQEADQMRAQQAAFRDLLALPRRSLRLNAFTLDGESAVAVSSLIDLARGMTVTTEPASTGRLTFSDDVFAMDQPAIQPDDPAAAEWLRLRMARAPLTSPALSGFVGPRSPEAYRVSSIDRYVDCPFKYFAERILGLPEEREELSGLSPLERGTLVHSLFEQFYRDWQAAGFGAITAETLPDALDRFAALARTSLAGLPAADRALEEVRLLGSIAARGLAERVFELEIDAGGRISHRFLETDLRGPFTFPRLNGLDQRSIHIRGKADRIDVLESGGLRVIDYKLSKAPDPETSIQIAVYAHAAQQKLIAEDGRPHPIVDAMYLAFGDERAFVTRLGSSPADSAYAVVARASAFTGVIDRIEAGEFPPRPLRPSECQWCRYAGVCRKEYPSQPNPADAAEPV
jgi:RecB family exonuclease